MTSECPFVKGNASINAIVLSVSVRIFCRNFTRSNFTKNTIHVIINQILIYYFCPCKAFTKLYVYSITRLCITVFNCFWNIIKSFNITNSIIICKNFNFFKTSSRIKFQNGKTTVARTSPAQLTHHQIWHHIFAHH